MGTVLRFHPDSEGQLAPKQRPGQLVQVFVGFWLLGLINNAAYVIMIAGANEIAASAVGLVYFCAIGPTILVKLTAPYWFHLVDYSLRFWVAALLMMASFCIVALSSNMAAQLAGVALVAVQGGLGEASALGLCALHPSTLSLTAWSSGTGFAGIMGYAWVAVLHHWLKLSYMTTLLSAIVMPCVWLVVFHYLLRLSRPPAASGARISMGSSRGSSSSGGSVANSSTRRRGPRYSALPVAAEDDNRQAFIRPDSSLGGNSSVAGHSINSSTSSSRITTPELELSSPLSLPPDSVELHHVILTTHDRPHHDLHLHLQQQSNSRTAPDLTQQEGRSGRGSAQSQALTNDRRQQQQQPQQLLQGQSDDAERIVEFSGDGSKADGNLKGGLKHPKRSSSSSGGKEQQEQQEQQLVLDPHSMTGVQRFKATCALWPYMVPLFVVYFAEYAMQSGTWTAIGFPVTSAEAREQFYLYSNWLYQAGVCISRSSGMLFQANRVVLWVMPLLQCLLLAFFSIDAALHLWWSWSLLSLCFVAGLLGGAVYVNSFTLMSLEVQPELKEFSLSAACVADSIGIACADLTAIFIQGCLFKLQGLPGAAFSCGAKTQ